MTALLILVLCVAVFWACWKALDALHNLWRARNYSVHIGLIRWWVLWRSTPTVRTVSSLKTANANAVQSLI